MFGIAWQSRLFIEAGDTCGRRVARTEVQAVGRGPVTAEAGKLRIAAPRPMVVKDLDDDVIALFLRLVEDPELQRGERCTPKPDLAPIVRRLQRRNVPIQRRPEVSVPVLNASFTADFAFQNGARHLVKAVGLSTYEETHSKKRATSARRASCL